jgi:hypothetical protein
MRNLSQCQQRCFRCRTQGCTFSPRPLSHMHRPRRVLLFTGSAASGMRHACRQWSRLQFHVLKQQCSLTPYCKQRFQDVACVHPSSLQFKVQEHP